MRPQTSNIIRSLPFFVAFLVLLTVPLATHALTVSPSRIEISGDPGETVDSEFDVVNEQGDQQTYYTSAENFDAQGESGTPSFVPGTSGLASWIALQPSVSLTAGQEEKVPFTITIPKDAPPGGYFAAAFLSSSQPQANQNQVSVGARIGVLVFLHVNGDVKESGGLIDFMTSGGRFFSSLPIDFSYRFNNQGGDRVEPVGTIVVKNFGITSTSLDANPSQGNVLPGSIRKFDALWGPQGIEAAPTGFFSAANFELHHFALGVYNARLTLNYGTHSSGSLAYTFFVFPWQLAIIIALILLVLYFVFGTLLKRYNRYVIETARRASK